MNELLQVSNVEEKINKERSCLKKNKRLYILSQIYNGINCSNNSIVKFDILKKY